MRSAGLASTTHTGSPLPGWDDMEAWAARLLGGLAGALLAVPLGIVVGLGYGRIAGWGADNWLPVHLPVGMLPLGFVAGAVLAPKMRDRIERMGRRP